MQTVRYHNRTWSALTWLADYLMVCTIISLLNHIPFHKNPTIIPPLKLLILAFFSAVLTQQTSGPGGLSEPLHHYSLLCGHFNCVILKWIDTFVKMNTEHVVYSHFCTANRPIFFITGTCHKYSYPQIPKICDPILVTLLKMQPHHSQSSRENAIPSSGTSPLACY